MRKKQICIILLSFFILSFIFINTKVYAAGDTKSILNGIYQKDSSSDTFLSKGSDILGIVVVIGYISAVCVAILVGIRFIIASPEGKAKIKEQIFIYVVGCMLLASGSTLIAIIRDLKLFS